MNQKVKEHFQHADPVIYQTMISLSGTQDAFGPSVTSDYFSDLCEAIVNQQLSEKAGRTIYNRFLDIFPDRKPTPELVSAADEQSLRDVGMSWSKVAFIRSLAGSFIRKDIDFEKITVMSDEDAKAELIKLHGIGPWTAEMFLMFSLGRQDVFSFGDVGLRRAIKKLYGFTKDPGEKQIKKIITKWSPYKTYACRILWKSLDIKNIVQ